MPRHNRSDRRSRRSGEQRSEPAESPGLENLLAGWRRTEARRGAEWNVQPISARQAVKSYRCPGCELPVAAGVAHVVVWRADGVLGDRSDLDSRRHWHSQCWSIS
ncbi:hypothetical protein [Homoserinimonas sp. OAct 916]|uniref:hypothetical protein n=1 Tax=Homoserinimonas sp. OAct 916 TaxID=2211450 RepID=UPI000DBE45F0|nr:hypothetical protein [Homoserinimonas sp. OAct 916]